jgi:hypothetical protein
MAETIRSKAAKADGQDVHGSRRNKGDPSSMTTTEAAEGVPSPRPSGDGSDSRPDRRNSAVRTPGSSPGSASEAGHDSAGGVNTGTDRVRWWKEWRTKIWTGAGAVLISALGIWLATWLGFFAGPHTPDTPSHTHSVKPIPDPGHLPGRLDVSTMEPGHRFYAIPNFYYDQSCGRPCWLPLYELPTEQSAFVTYGWPCEYYGPNDSSDPSCTRPPARRKTSEMADPANRNSGDWLLVLCQTTNISKGNPAQTIKNQVGQSSNIWDMVALPKSYVSSDSAAEHLAQVPGMPGFYEVFAPDMWLGNTGSHAIPCS